MKNLTYVLDIGSSKISLLACYVGKNKSAIITSIDKDYDGFMDGEFFSTEQVKLVIAELVSEMQNRVRKSIEVIHIGVPSEFSACVCKRVTKQFVPSRRIQEHELVEMFDGVNEFSQKDEYIVASFSPIQYEFDGITSIKLSNQRVSKFVMDCSYILIKKQFAEFITATLNEIGVRDVDFISTALAQAQFARKTISDPLQPIVIVDVGHITTSVAISKGEGLLMLSSFSLGGGHITADLMQVNNLTYSQADKIKRNVCLTVQSRKDEKYIVYDNNQPIKALINITNDIVNSRIENIASVVLKVLSVNSEFAKLPVYLTGDGICNFRGAINVFESVLNTNISVLKSHLHNDKDKYQTSKIALANIIEDLV